MNEAIFFLGTLIGLLFGAVAHLIFNGSLRTLAAYLTLGVVGFWGWTFCGCVVGDVFCWKDRETLFAEWHSDECFIFTVGLCR